MSWGWGVAETLKATLYSPTQAHGEVRRAWEWIKPMLMAGHRLEFSVREQAKSREQEEKYHAMIGEVARQAQHLGSKWDAEAWKRLLLDSFAKETGRQRGRLIPGLDGDGVVEVGLLSRKFSVKDGSEFIEWLHAWGAANGVVFREEP